jgi:hypothetical protein
MSKARFYFWGREGSDCIKAAIISDEKTKVNILWQKQRRTGLMLRPGQYGGWLPMIQTLSFLMAYVFSFDKSDRHY